VGRLPGVTQRPKTDALIAQVFGIGLKGRWNIAQGNALGKEGDTKNTP